MQNNQKINTGLLCVIVVLLVVIAMLLSMQKNNNPKNENKQTVSEQNLIPEKNTLYFGTYNNDQKLFFTNTDIQERGSAPYDGFLFQQTGDNFDFRKLSGFKKIFSSDRKIESINDFVLNDAQNVIYVSLQIDNQNGQNYPNNESNKVFQIDLRSLAVQEVWSRDIGVRSEKYPNVDGPAYLNKIAGDKYLVLDMYGCFACGGGDHFEGMIVLNLATKAEKYLAYPNIGNIRFNLANQTFSYQKLAPVADPCDHSDSIECQGIRITAYKPSGAPMNERLP